MSPDSQQADEESLASLADDLREAFGPGAGWLRPGEEVGSGRSGSLWDREAAEHHEDFRAGERLGDFELQDEIGRGGMGIVFRATQVSLNRVVALKVLNGRPRGAHRAVARFQRESRVAGRLHHTNIVPVYAQGEHSGVFYYAMELIEGQSLDLAMRSDSSATNLTLNPTSFASSAPLDASTPAAHPNGSTPGKRRVTDLPRRREVYRRIAGLMAEVCDGLEHAHQAKIVHRDIKPQNLLLGLDNHLHITDFGLAMGADEPQLTLDGELMGTPTYMAPEQIGAIPAPVEARTDLYALGVTLYEVLTLRRPFEGANRAEVIHKIATDSAVPPRRVDPRIPKDLETICLRALEKEPSRRYASASAMGVDLRRFAEDRPILTRRIGPVSRGIKWARRHKAASIAIVSVALTVFLATALLASVSASRRQLVQARQEEAEARLRRAREQLVYRDYRKPELVAADLDDAERLGASRRQLSKLRALAAMNAPDSNIPIGYLEEALQLDPHDREARYLLAWAHSRNGNRQASGAALQAAEEPSVARTAAEWFFRGLVLHRDDPSKAADSYKEARRMRALEHELFPQATLHLARAYNQLMYQTRRIEVFEETANMLRELINYEIYDSYPYYLLSIAHRLAAEVYEDSIGTRNENAENHFQQALEWAERGRQVGGAEPDRPVTAAAECYESLGDFPTAIEARTTAIGLAQSPRHRIEGYGYRWRLYFWENKLDNALNDLKVLQESDPHEIFFSTIYPMLVQADAGRMDEALTQARSVAAESPANAQRLIWGATCLRLLGQPAEADRLLTEVPDSLDFRDGLVEPQSETWVRTLLDFVAHRVTLENLLRLTENIDSPWKLRGEAYFHSAAMKLSQSDRAGALLDFEESYRSFDNQRRFTYHARILLVKLRREPNWPAWIPLGGSAHE